MIKSLDASTATIIRRTGEDFGADTPSKVLVGGKQYHFKPVQEEHSFLREFGILYKLAKTGLNVKCRVPTIYSLIHYTNEEESILGFLMEVINSKDKMSTLFRRENTESEQRQKWFSQIEETVRQLHENGIVWGDIKPNNVLIDKEDNAWVVDFGGGYNAGFVDEDVIETVEGDVQGVSRIKKWLKV
jgi:serine/threonine protein kinase